MPPPLAVTGPSAISVLRRSEIPALPRSRSVDWLFIAKAVGLIALTCACYWPALDGTFLWDDGLLVADNPLLKSLAGLTDIWASTKPYDFFPLTYTTFWVEWHCWGNDATGYHLVNLALHLASASLLWKLLQALRLPGAWFGALLFAVHPLNVASIAWISELKNALAMLFYLACLYSFARSDDPPVRRSGWRWYLLSIGCFVLAVLSKSSVVMLPFVLLLLCWWKRGRVTWGELAQTIPFFGVSLSGGLATMWFQYHRAMSTDIYAGIHLSADARVLMAGRSAWFYLSKALLPIHLSMLYPRWHVGTSSCADYLPLAGWLVLLGVAWVGQRSWGRGPFVILVYFTLSLLPVTGIFQLSFFTYSYVSDHLTHLALLGIVVGVSSALAAWQDSRSRSARLAPSVMTLTAGLLSVLCFCRADDFSSPEKLWERTREVVPDHFAVYLNLGTAALSHGHLSDAEKDFYIATRLEPHSFSALDHLADVLREEQKWRESASIYEIILRTEPNAECFNNLGVDLLEMGDTFHARTAFKQAIAKAPSASGPYFNLYKAEISDGHFPAAEVALREVLRCDPDDAEAMTALAWLILTNHDTETPNFDPARSEAARRLADHACRLTSGQNAQALLALGKALLATEHPDQAAFVTRKADALSVKIQQTFRESEESVAPHVVTPPR